MILVGFKNQEAGPQKHGIFDDRARNSSNLRLPPHIHTRPQQHSCNAATR